MGSTIAGAPDDALAHVSRALDSAARDILGGEAPPEVILETPRNPEHGDFSSNVALQLAKRARRPPQQLAHEIAAKLGSDPTLRDVVAEVTALKQQPGKDIVILGSAELASFLLQAGLIDEYRVILNPILVGSGNPLFKGIKEKIKLRLTETKQFGSGVMVLYYQPA